MLFVVAYGNALMCAINVAAFLQWEATLNASVAVLCGFVALIAGMQATGRR